MPNRLGSISTNDKNDVYVVLLGFLDYLSDGGIILFKILRLQVEKIEFSFMKCNYIQTNKIVASFFYFYNKYKSEPVNVL